MPVSIAEFRAAAIAELEAAGVPTPEVDTDILIGHELTLTRGQVQAKAIAGAVMSDEEARELRSMLDRRVMRMPVQHIIARAYFRALELAVDDGVFIPRPE